MPHFNVQHGIDNKHFHTFCGYLLHQICEKMKINKKIIGNVFFQAFGYIEIELRDFKQFEGMEIADFTDFKVKKVNKTHRMLVGTSEVFAPDFDNSVQVEMQLYQKQGGEYRKLPYKISPKGSCDFFNEDEVLYPEIAAVSDVPNPMPCPMPQVILLLFDLKKYSNRIFSENTPFSATHQP